MNVTVAHEEDGHLTGVTEFDWDQVERELGSWSPESDLTELTPQEMEAARRALKIILQWVFQNGSKNIQGVGIRAVIACSVFLEELHPLTETQLARGYGMHKQSIGRWVEDWKRCFPDLRTCHMR